MALSASRKGSKLRFAESVSETVIQNGGFEQPEENNVMDVHVASAVSESEIEVDQLKNIDQNTIEVDCCDATLAEPTHSVDNLSIPDVVEDGKHGSELDTEQKRIEVKDRNTVHNQVVQDVSIPNATVATKEAAAPVEQNQQSIGSTSQNTLVSQQENGMKELPAKEAAFVSLMRNKRGTQRTAYFERDVYDYIQDKADTYGIKFSNVMNLLLKEAIQNRES